MEKLRIPNDKEFMKMAMLKHEQTFKEQVYELHRLYQIQKILMQSSRSNTHKQESGHNNSHVLERRNEEKIVKSESERNLDIIDETDIELTLGPASYSRRRESTSDSGQSLSSSSTEFSHVNRTYSMTKKKTKPTMLNTMTYLVL